MKNKIKASLIFILIILMIPTLVGVLGFIESKRFSYYFVNSLAIITGTLITVILAACILNKGIELWEKEK